MGSNITIDGTVSGSEPVLIEGTVRGKINLTNELRIGTKARVEATVHAKNGFFTAKGGIELGLLYASAALAFASSGYGDLSLDHALGLDEKLRHPAFTALALAAGIAAGYGVLGRRETGPPEGTLATPTIKGGERNGSSTAQRSPAAS